MSGENYETGLHVDVTEKLIEAVEARPGIYNKNLKEYSNKNVVSTLWTQVCEIVVDSWHDLTPQQKNNKGKEIQQKWRNLRTCFMRELSKQKKGKSGQAAEKRRKYIYFHKLLFLLPTISNRETVSETDPLLLDEEASSSGNFNTCQGTSNHHHDNSKSSENRKRSYEEQLLEILKGKQEEKIDEDKLFLLSLMPSFKKMNDEQKMVAKIQILTVIKNITQAPCSSTATAANQNIIPQIVEERTHPGPTTLIHSENSIQSWLQSDTACSSEFCDL